jgi:hypothetical protein
MHAALQMADCNGEIKYFMLEDGWIFVLTAEREREREYLNFNPNKIKKQEGTKKNRKGRNV